MSDEKKKVYLICDWADGKATSMDHAPNIGVEFMGNCSGRVVAEDGEVLGGHYSSTIGWLRMDLTSKLSEPDQYEIIDLLREEVPERFRLKDD